MKFTNEKSIIKNNITRDWFDCECFWDRNITGGQFTNNESIFLYNFVRYLKPKKILEFSPFGGHTSIIINSALKDENILFDYFKTHEIDKRCCEETKKNLEFYGFSGVEIIFGDVLKTMDLNLLSDCNFLFVDSDHGEEFCIKYVDKFFGKLKKGTWVGVHDIWNHESNKETKIIMDYIYKNNIDEYFHVNDLSKIFNINDAIVNPFNKKNIENSTLIFFKV